MTAEISKEKLAKIGAKTRVKSGKKAAELGSAGGIASGVAKKRKADNA